MNRPTDRGLPGPRAPLLRRTPGRPEAGRALSFAPASSADPLLAPATPRLELIDRLRGLVIALMVLDHVREYWSDTALVFQATDLARTTPALFATRWVTHLCAPTFVFLAGASAYLQRARATRRADVARFLLARGLWLIVLELTAVSFALSFSYPFFFFQVIWAIGFGLVTLGALVWLPPAAVLALGVLVVAGHDALAPVNAQDLGALGPAWRLLMELGPLPLPLASAPGFVAYPALPWTGVLWLGYGLGAVFTRPDAERRRALVGLGFGALALFAVLRLTNGYGEPQPWAPHPRGPVFTALSVLNVSKYPPSLQFVLVTLGVSLPVGVALERLRGRVGGAVGRLLLALGRTPLFTYLLHLYLVHGLALLAGVALGFRAADFTNFPNDTARLVSGGWGFGLPAVYAIWLLVVAALYPAARWYAARKQRRHARWMRYL